MPPSDAANAAQFADEINRIVPLLRIALAHTPFRDDAIVSAIMVYAGENLRGQRFPNEQFKQRCIEQCIMLFRQACDRAGPVISPHGRVQ
jgi:hypothetical protein